MLVNGKNYRTVWMEKSIVCMINQPLLPHRFEIYRSQNSRETAKAITTMITRGAGALAVAAAYGMVQVFMEAENDGDVFNGYKLLKNTRPTAQNLFYAIDRVYKAGLKEKDKNSRVSSALKKAVEIADEDSLFASKIGEYGSGLISHDAGILTHCNAGWLAFTDWGTALSPIYKANEDGKNVTVYVDETRPRLQGARLTAWELTENNIPHYIISDNAAASYMARGKIDMVITGADRIAANGDTANKIGTLGRAILAKHYQIPFYIAAPTTTIDFECENGDSIPIEERNEDEVHYIFGKNDQGEITRVRVSPEKSEALNPAFDVTPAELITGIITEKGIFTPHEINKTKDQ